MAPVLNAERQASLTSPPTAAPARQQLLHRLSHTQHAAQPWWQRGSHCVGGSPHAELCLHACGHALRAVPPWRRLPACQHGNHPGADDQPATAAADHSGLCGQPEGRYSSTRRCRRRWPPAAAPRHVFVFVCWRRRRSSECGCAQRRAYVSQPAWHVPHTTAFEHAPRSAQLEHGDARFVAQSPGTCARL